MNDIQLVIIMATGAAFVVNLTAIFVAIYKLGRAVERFERIGMQQALEISDMKVAIGKIADLIVSTALQTQRLDNLSSRMGRVEQLIDDVRRGEGMIAPFKGAHEVP